MMERHKMSLWTIMKVEQVSCYLRIADQNPEDIPVYTRNCVSTMIMEQVVNNFVSFGSQPGRV